MTMQLQRGAQCNAMTLYNVVTHPLDCDFGQLIKSLIRVSVTRGDESYSSP